jgi:hypothetical protein
MQKLQKLGLNRGRYLGETIDIDVFLKELGRDASAQGWRAELLPVPDSTVRLQTWQRRGEPVRRRVYISAGIHGDEPAGPLAVRQLIQQDRWPKDVGVWLCPCLNPTGFPLNTRENARGVDLNRQYLELEAPETRAHVHWLQEQPAFDLALCLHEDWESHGFYLYELNLGGAPSRAEQIIRDVEEVCPIDRSPEIEGRPAVQGVIRPSPDPKLRPQWPEAFWLFQNKVKHCFTLEAPSDFPLAIRVAALVTAVGSALRA